MTVLFRDDFNGSAGALGGGWTSGGSLALDGAGFATGTGNADHSLTVPSGVSWVEVEFGVTMGGAGEMAIAVGPSGTVASTNPGNPGGKVYLDTFFASGITLHAADGNSIIAPDTGLSTAHVFIMRITAGSPTVTLKKDGTPIGTKDNSGSVPMANLVGIDAIRFGTTFTAKVDYIEVRDSVGATTPDFWTDFVHTFEVV